MSDLKKIKIQEAAEKLFKVHSYKDTTIRMISNESGVPISGIYRYFQDKQSIIDSIDATDIPLQAPSQIEKKQKVLKAASKSFALNGYEKTTMDGIAKIAGVSKKYIYRLYDHKERLFIEIIRSTLKMERFFDIEKEQKNNQNNTTLPKMSFFDIGMNFVSIFREENSVQIIKTIIADALRFPEVGDIFFKEVVEKPSIILSKRIIGPTMTEEQAITHVRLFFGSLFSFMIAQNIWQTSGVKYDVEMVVHHTVDLFFNTYEK